MALSYGNLWTVTLAGDASGYVKNLETKVKTLTITIDDSAGTGDCWVRAAISPSEAPTAPSGTPAPAAKALSAAGWRHLKGVGSSLHFPSLEFGYYQYIEVWDVGAGGLIIDGQDT